MRKYHQAALAITAMISLAALIFYRHEYHKLRFVLEALNYFGHPGEKLSQSDCNDLKISTNDNLTSSEFANDRFGQPLPSWQRLNDDAYVYSSYAFDDRRILSLGFARVKALKLLSCRIYYENNVEPVDGIFTYKTVGESSIIEKNGDSTKRGIYSAYRLICVNEDVETSNKRISGVSFADRSRSIDDAVVIAVKTMYKSSNDSRDVALCVAPMDSRTIVMNDMIDFVSFHNAIGIKHFVVYDFGIPRTFNRIFETMSRQLSFSYTTIPWNFPFGEISKEIVERIIRTDCRYRTYENVEIVATLTWNDFIVMEHHRTVVKLFTDIDAIGYVADRYEVGTSKICVHNEKSLTNGNDDRGIVIGSEPFARVRPIYFYRSAIDRTKIVNDDDGKTRETTDDVIYVNRYVTRCNVSLTLTLPEDRYVGKFEKNVRNLPIWKFYRMYENSL